MIEEQIAEIYDNFSKELIDAVNKFGKELKKALADKEEPKEENKYKRWQADVGEEYYFIAGGGSIIDCQDDDSCEDNYRYMVGNYFKTQEEVEEYRENLKTRQELKDIALELNQGREIDWEDYQNRPYCISYAHDGRSLLQHNTFDIQDLGQVYCLDKDFLNIALERIGEERLTKLIKSGV